MTIWPVIYNNTRIFKKLLTLHFGISKYRDSLDNTQLKRTQASLPNLNALVAVSKGMRAVKLCTNKILHFLTGGAG